MRYEYVQKVPPEGGPQVEVLELEGASAQLSPISGMPDGNVVFSVWCRAPSAVTISIEIGSTSESFPVTSSWQRLVITATEPDDVIITVPANSTAWLYKAQLEIGSRPTDWREAPEDLSESVVSLVQVQYALSSSTFTPPTSGWQATMPQHSSGTYVWQKTVTTYNSGETSESAPVCVSAEDATVLRIDSSRGTMFKNNAVSTVLSAVIYHGGQRITDITSLRAAYGASAHIQWSWQRIDENRFGILSADDSRLSGDGFFLTLSTDDVDTKVTIMCELITN